MQSEPGPVTVFIGLGGNIGDVVGSMVAACIELSRHEQCWLLHKARLYRTPPWGDKDQDWFVNSAISVATNLEPEALLDTLKKAEKTLKREKTRRWGPRTIDLDILIYGELELATDRLTIPHPRLTERAFVLMPLNDLAPNLVPAPALSSRTACQWLEQVDRSGIEVLSDERWTAG